MRAALRAFGHATRTVVLAPHLVAVAVLAMVLAAAPFGAWLNARLQPAMPPDALTRNPAEIDPEWWSEYRRHATGLEATFTPAIVGFAGPLSNVSAILDGTIAPVMLLPATIAVMLWAFLWGGFLHRFARGGAPLREFLRAALRYWPPFMVIALAAAAAQLALYLSVHRLLFGWLFERVASSGVSEPVAVLIRVAFYLVFGALLALVMLVADYARAFAAVTGDRGVARVLRHSWLFIRDASASVISLYALTGLLFVILMIAYGASELAGGSRLGGWRAIALGQGFIIARVIIRLISGASEVALIKMHIEHPDGQ